MGLVRLLLAVSVVVAHSAPFFGLTFVGGVVAVELFFIISGFYMSLILDRKYSGEGYYTLFLSNRFLRLFPVYWVVLLVTLLVCVSSGFLFDDWLRLEVFIANFQELPFGVALLVVFGNILLVGQDVLLFSGVDLASGSFYFANDFMTTDPRLSTFLLVPQAWSLSIEIVFYIIAPFVVRRGVLPLIIMVFASAAVRGVTYFVFDLAHDPWTYRFLPSELALFFLGAISYKLYSFISAKTFDGWWDVVHKALYVLTVGVIIGYQFAQIDGALKHLVNWALYAAFSLSLPYVFFLTKNNAYDSRVGELSYPIYVSHFLVILTFEPIIAGLGWEQGKGEIVVASTIFLSWLLVVFVSDPVEKIRYIRVKNLEAGNSRRS